AFAKFANMSGLRADKHDPVGGLQCIAHVPKRDQLEFLRSRPYVLLTRVDSTVFWGRSSELRKRYCTWLIDSDRWYAFQPRPGDIIVATYPKSGTTWMQRILSLLIFRTEEPLALDRMFPWLEVNRRPIEAVVNDLEAQQHRRSVKTHVPFDGVPRFETAKYIHVARDGRDVCMSYHNHCTGFRPEALERMDAIGLAEPTLRRTYPRVDPDPAVHFHNWLTTGAIDGQRDGTPYLSYFAYEKTFWDARKQNNLLFVHYDDLQANLTGEMR